MTGARNAENPLYYVQGRRALAPDGYWTLDALIRVTGRPDTYPSHTVRLFVGSVMRVDDLDIPNLLRVLADYAAFYGVDVTLTYYPSGVPLVRNIPSVDGATAQQRLLVEIMSEEVLGQSGGGRRIFEAMKLVPSKFRTYPDRVDVSQMMRGGYLSLRPDSEYDSTILAVLKMRKGEFEWFEYPIMPSR